MCVGMHEMCFDISNTELKRGIVEGPLPPYYWLTVLVIITCTTIDAQMGLTDTDKNGSNLDVLSL